MQWSLNMVHSHFTLWLRVCEYLKWLSQHLGTAFGWEARVLTITRPWLLPRVWSGPYLGSLHIRDNEHVTATLQTISLVGKVEPVPSSLHTYARGTDGVCECKMDTKSTWIPTWHQMDHLSWSLGLFPPLGGRPNTKPGDHGTPNTHNRWFVLLYRAWGPAWIEINWNSIWLRARSHMTSHSTWGYVTTLHTWCLLEVCWDNGLWTFSFGLSQFHGCGSWLVCEVALMPPPHRTLARLP